MPSVEARPFVGLPSDGARQGNSELSEVQLFSASHSAPIEFAGYSTSGRSRNATLGSVRRILAVEIALGATAVHGRFGQAEDRLVVGQPGEVCDAR